MPGWFEMLPTPVVAFSNSVRKWLDLIAFPISLFLCCLSLCCSLFLLFHVCVVHIGIKSDVFDQFIDLTDIMAYLPLQAHYG